VNKNALNRFNLVAPVLHSICQSFNQINGLTKELRDKHYQFTGSTNSRITNNASKLYQYFESLDLNFVNSEYVYNITSIAVLPENDAKDVLDQLEIGKHMWDTFVHDRVCGDKSIWDTMKKRKLLTFKSSAKTLKIKIERQVVELK